MAELADAPDLGSGGNPVQVQVLLSAVYERYQQRKIWVVHDSFWMIGTLEIHRLAIKKCTLILRSYAEVVQIHYLSFVIH